MSIPNLITLARIILVPIVVWAITSGQMLAAFALFVAAGISDAIDGFLAKRFHMASELGAYLDPLADKALIVSIYVALGITGAGLASDFNGAGLVAAIRGAQADTVRYPEFVERSTAAGVIGYWALLTGKRGDLFRQERRAAHRACA